MAQVVTEQFVAAARGLFEAEPGSPIQREAHEWLLSFQQSPESWHAALRVLELSTLDHDDHIPPTVLLVTMQLLRFKIAHTWAILAQHERIHVRQSLMRWLQRAETIEHISAYSPALRTCCLVVAEAIVRGSADEWPGWHQDLKQSLVQGPSGTSSLILMEIYTAIPIQLRSHVEDKSLLLQDRIHEFVLVQDDVVRITTEELAVHGPQCETAVRCIESWMVGMCPGYDDLGITITKLAQTPLLSLLLRQLSSDDDALAKAAGDIVADVVASSVSDPATTNDESIGAIVQVVGQVISFRDLLVAGASKTDYSVRICCRALSRIASAVVLHHGLIVFSPSAAARFAASAPAAPSSLALCFLEFLLQCTAFPDSECAQPTLEFWFFILDDTPAGVPQRALLSTQVSLDQLVEILGRVVNTLIQRSRYPEYFLNQADLGEGDEEVESVAQLRTEIADTLLSLFSKWPTCALGDRGVSCVKGMAALLRSERDVATLDAVLFLLERCIELFDIESSDSEADDDDEGSVHPQASHESVYTLQQIVLDAVRLPAHPALLRGTAKFTRSVSKMLVLSGEIYTEVALYMCRGLDAQISYGVSADALRSMSKNIVESTEVAERRALLSIVASKCTNLLPELAPAGNLLEAAFRLTDGTSDAEFTSICNHILSKLTQDLASEDATVVANAVTLLGRAVGGVALDSRRAALTEQVWPLLSAAIIRHDAIAAVRECTLQFFCDAVASNPVIALARQRELVRFCLHWFPHAVSPVTLRCLTMVISHVAPEQAGEFEDVVAEIVQTTVAVTAERIQFQSVLDDHANRARFDAVFASHQTTQLVTPEIIAFFQLAGRAVLSFPSSWHQLGSQCLVTALRLSCLLLDVNHQVQEICDAVCDFLLEVCSSQQLLSSSPAASGLLQLSSSVVQAVLGHFGSKRVYYKQRNVWLFLFQLLHSPRVVEPVKVHFHASLQRVLAHDGVLSPPLSKDQATTLAANLVSTRQRHRFLLVLNQVGKEFP